MQRRQFTFRILKQSLLGTAACALPGCGTLFHAERVGQPHSRDIDWQIVALDGLGLLLFFVPGVIAFIVDFGTGAIYLPPEGMGAYPYSRPTPPASSSRIETSSSHTSVNLKRIPLSREKLQPRHIEKIVASETGCEISLDDADTRLSKLSSVDYFGEQLASHRRDRNFGHSVKAFFSQIIPT